MEKIRRPIDITFEDVVYSVPVPKKRDKKQVLKGVSGTFKSGELTAIMGPSGAGKSSLLNILTGFTKHGVKGSISMGSSDDEKLNNRKICSYILQDDNLFPNFTVQENMIMAARLKISKQGLSDENKNELIDNILELLHLTHTKTTKCSNLSGGQKKRLSIALEMLDNPNVLFLDEPTTGLDSSSSSYCVRLLHDLAREGRTIVCTIHQPQASVYEMFDHVYVLAEGNCVYQGSADNTVSYLGSLGLQCPQYHNSADYMLEVANSEYGNFITDLATAATDERWRHSQVLINKSLHTEIEQFQEEPSRKCKNALSRPTEWSRLWVLVGRCHIQYYRDWTVTHLKLLLHVICAIMVGLIFGDTGINAQKVISNVGCLLIGILYIWYTTMMPGVLRFPSEIAIIKKETFNNWYKLRTYYLATVITSTPIHILFSTVFGTIIFFLTEQPNEIDRYMKFIFVYILITIVADGFGVLLGTLLDPINGTFIGAIMTCFWLAFSGFLVLFPHMPVLLVYVSYSSIFRYGLEGLLVSLLGNQRADLYCPEDVIYCHYKSASFFLKELGMTSSNYEFDILMLVVQLCVFKVLAFFTLKRRMNSAN